LVDVDVIIYINRIKNYDDNESSICGNGIKTDAFYLSEKKNLAEYKIQTMHADLEVKKADKLSEKVPSFDAEISPVSFNAQDLLMHVGKEKLIDDYIPELSETIKFYAVEVHNPHLFAFVDH